MTSSRFTALSAASRQWVVEEYTPLIAQHTDKHRRQGLFFDILHEAAANGELCALEYLQALTSPSIAALDDELMDKIVKLAETTSHDGGSTGAGTTDGAAGDCTGPTSCGPGDVPQQRTLFPLSVIEDKIQDIRRKLQRIDAECKRLREQERDSREVRKMMRAEKQLLEVQLARLEQARTRAQAAPHVGMDNLDELGLEPDVLGLNTLAAL